MKLPTYLQIFDGVAKFILISMFTVVAVAVGVDAWDRNRRLPFDSLSWKERPDKRYQMIDDLFAKLEKMKNDPRALGLVAEMLEVTRPQESGRGYLIRESIGRSGVVFTQGAGHIVLYFKKDGSLHLIQCSQGDS